MKPKSKKMRLNPDKSSRGSSEGTNGVIIKCSTCERELVGGAMQGGKQKLSDRHMTISTEMRLAIVFILRSQTIGTFRAPNVHCCEQCIRAVRGDHGPTKIILDIRKVLVASPPLVGESDEKFEAREILAAAPIPEPALSQKEEAMRLPNCAKENFVFVSPYFYRNFHHP